MFPYYRIILKRALKISWKNKWLWVLGFFAAFIGNGGVYETLLRSFNNISEGNTIFDIVLEYSKMGVLGLSSWSNVSRLWETDSAAFVMNLFVIILFFCIFAIFVSLGVIGQGSLIRSVVDLDRGKKVKVKDSLKVGLHRFWSVLKLNFITKIILLGALLSLAYFATLVRFQNATLNLFVYATAFILFIVFAIIVYFITIYGTAFIVLRNKKAIESLKLSWKLFSRSILLSLEMGLLLFIINIILGTLFVFVTFILLAPFILLFLIFMMAGASSATSIFGGIILVLFFIMMLLMGSWFSSFQLGAWAILFEELELNGGKSKIRRLFDHVKGHVSKKLKRRR